MKKSTATWKIAVGHHTMRSVSAHGDTQELLELLLPVLKVTLIKSSTLIFYQLVSHMSIRWNLRWFHRKTVSISTSMGMITAWSTSAAETGEHTNTLWHNRGKKGSRILCSSSSLFSPIQYFTSGGGSKAWRGIFQQNEDKLQFFYDGQGFLSLELSENRARFAFYDVFGQALYHWSFSKPNLQKVQSSASVTEEWEKLEPSEYIPTQLSRCLPA